MQSSTAPTSTAEPHLGGLTSDHTHQSITATLLTENDRPLLQLRGSTWNLMNYCFSLETHGRYKNNPWNIDERPVDYMFRKIQQMEKICKILLEDGGKDFMFLQEIDFFYLPILVAPEKWAAMSLLEQQNLQEIQRQQIILRSIFERKLLTLGYLIHYSTSYQPLSVQQPLAIIFNMRTLLLFGNQEPGAFPNRRHIFRGFGLNFLHRQSNFRVRLVCLHLDFDHDYSQEITPYQQFYIDQNIFMIMGGDTNHAPNDKISGMINHHTNTTNINSEIVNGKLQFSGDHSPAMKKCYDGFFVSPTKNTKVLAKQERSEVFTLDGGRPTVRVLNPEQEYSFHASHQSAIGLPICTLPPKKTRRLWMPPAELLNDNNAALPPPTPTTKPN